MSPIKSGIAAAAVCLLATSAPAVLADNPVPGGCLSGDTYTERYTTFTQTTLTLVSVRKNGEPVTDTSAQVKVGAAGLIPISHFDSLVTVNHALDGQGAGISGFLLWDPAGLRVNIPLQKAIP